MEMSLSRAYTLADELMDSGSEEAARAINFAAGTADQYRKWMRKLAWAALEKNSHKRKQALAIVLAEMDASGESTAEFPMRSYCA